MVIGSDHLSSIVLSVVEKSEGAGYVVYVCGVGICLCVHDQQTQSGDSSADSQPVTFKMVRINGCWVSDGEGTWLGINRNLSIYSRRA